MLSIRKKISDKIVIIGILACIWGLHHWKLLVCLTDIIGYNTELSYSEELQLRRLIK